MTNTNPRPKVAPHTNPEEVSVANLVVDELRRHGPATAAELIASVGAPVWHVFDSVMRLHTAGVVRLVTVRGEQCFTLRQREDNR